MNNKGSSVFIQVDHNVFGSARCSGLQFDNVIIAHGSLLYLLSSNNGSIKDEDDILKNFQLIVSELKQQQYFVKPEKCKGKVTFNFKVLKKNVPGLNVIKSYIDDTEYVERKTSSSEIFSFEDARLCLIHKYEDGITTDISKLGFAEGQNIDYNSYEYLVIPVFLFLMTGIPTKYLFEKTSNALLTFITGIQICPGLSIAVESTPFASLAFYNSLSRGIISKTLGPDQEELLIDARLVFGCEGAPIYVFEGGSKGAVIGIVVCMVSRCDEEWVGFSLGLSLKHLLKSVLGLKTSDYIPFNQVKLPYPASFLDTELLSSAVIFVRCQHKWGSGVVVDADSGLILTCSHIVHHAQDSVHVVFEGKKYRTVVEYASPPSDPYDLALLSVGKIPGLRSLAIAESSPVLGESVITVGYALSTESSVIANGAPTLSGGCVAKVSLRGGPLQTRCCTQSGVSGGAVLRPPNQLIGIVVSNVRVGTSVLPYFSFAVSVDDFRTAIAQFIHTKDPTCLQSLNVKSPEVKMKWRLQDSKL